MKIVKHGVKKKLCGVRFKCDSCGCVFDAELDECKRAEGGMGHPYHICNCPECGNVEYSDEFRYEIESHS